MIAPQLLGVTRHWPHVVMLRLVVPGVSLTVLKHEAARPMRYA